MTMLQRIMRAVKSNGGHKRGLNSYYSNLLGTRIGDTGLPTAREAQRDLDAVLRMPTYF